MSLSGLASRQTQDHLLPTMMRWLGIWDKEKYYYKNECVVAPDKILYISLTAGNNKDPQKEPDHWQPFSADVHALKLELEEQKKSSMKTTTWIEQQLPQEFAKSQKQIQELSEAILQVQHENKSLRDELQSLRATLVEVLDALTANANGSPKGGPCANSSSEQ